MTMRTAILTTLCFAGFVHSDEPRPIKWEIGSVGVLKSNKPAAPKGVTIADVFLAAEVLGEDRLLVESERRWQERGFTQGGFVAVRTIKKAKLYKPFVLKGPSTESVRPKAELKVTGEYKVAGTMKHKGIVYFVIEPVEPMR